MFLGEENAPVWMKALSRYAPGLPQGSGHGAAGLASGQGRGLAGEGDREKRSQERVGDCVLHRAGTCDLRGLSGRPQVIIKHPLCAWI